MQRDAPEEARATILQALTAPDGEKQNFSKLDSLIATWHRRRQLELNSGREEQDKAAFFKHWEGLGRTPDNIQKKWKEATSKEAMNAGLCHYVGKKKMVWTLLPRRMMNRDIVAHTYAGTPETLQMTTQQRRDMLHGKGGVAMDAASAPFGG